MTNPNKRYKHGSPKILEKSGRQLRRYIEESSPIAQASILRDFLKEMRERALVPMAVNVLRFYHTHYQGSHNKKDKYARTIDTLIGMPYFCVHTVHRWQQSWESVATSATRSRLRSLEKDVTRGVLEASRPRVPELVQMMYTFAEFCSLLAELRHAFDTVFLESAAYGMCRITQKPSIWRAMQVLLLNPYLDSNTQQLNKPARVAHLVERWEASHLDVLTSGVRTDNLRAMMLLLHYSGEILHDLFGYRRYLIFSPGNRPWGHLLRENQPRFRLMLGGMEDDE